MSAMPQVPQSWPRDPIVMQNALMDSQRWKNVNIREGDVIIASYGKSGTTWVQQIVGQILSRGDPATEVAKASPWVDMRLVPPEVYFALEASGKRRFFKTHSLPHAIPHSPLAKYLYVGRDGRDICWSLHNHFSSFTDDFLSTLNSVPGRFGPPQVRGAADVHQFYTDWIERDGTPSWSFWENIRSWWEARTFPNVQLIHFNDLKADLEKSVNEVAAFLGAPLDGRDIPKILRHCSFAYMKDNAASSAPRGGDAFVGGAKTFINKGTNGRWRDVLSASEISDYESRALAELGPECAEWLQHGGTVE